MDISIIVPLLNEEESLTELSNWIDKVCNTHKLSYELIYIDDGSTDSSWNVIEDITNKNPAVKGIKFRRNYGKSAALNVGFEAAEGDVIITMDADGTCLFEHYPRLIKHMVDNGVDFITARRIPDRFRTFTSLLRFLGDMFLDVTCWIFFRFWIYDSQSGVWAFKREILSRINLESDGWALSEEIKIETFTHPKLKAAELPILYINIRLGDSKLRMWRDGFANLCYIVKKWKEKKTAKQVSPSSR